MERKKFYLILVIIFVIFTTQLVFAQKKVLKCAILAPQGSTWMNVLEEWNNDLKAKSNENVSFKFYASGSMGDETAVIRKMKSGQLDAGGVTGIGLGLVTSEVRLLELPFQFNDYKEIDYVMSNMEEIYGKKFEEKGFVLLAWSESGFVYIFSNKPIKTKEDMKGVKIWMWEGDEMVKEVFNLLNVSPTPLAITDVLTSLQTKLIDAVYAPPLAASALQWTTKVKYMLSQKLAFSVGAILISKKSFDTLSQPDQQLLKDTAKIYAKKLTDSIRKENEEAKEAIKASGIEFVDATPETIAYFQEISEKAADNLVGKLYSKELLDKIRELKKNVK